MSTSNYCAQVLVARSQGPVLLVERSVGADGDCRPEARDVLQQLVDEDISDAAFPFLSARAMALRGGIHARLFRISFSGELAFELAVPARLR